MAEFRPNVSQSTLHFARFAICSAWLRRGREVVSYGLSPKGTALSALSLRLLLSPLPPPQPPGVSASTAALRNPQMYASPPVSCRSSDGSPPLARTAARLRT